MKHLLLIASLILMSNSALAEDIVPDVPNFKLDDLDLVIIPAGPQRTPGEFGEKQFWITQGSLAPFDGVLLNTEAMAFILTEYKALEARANAALANQRELDLSKLNLEVGRLHLEVQAQNKKSILELQGRDEELKACQKITKEIRDDNSGFKRKLFVGLGSGVGGLVIGALLGLFVLQN